MTKRRENMRTGEPWTIGSSGNGRKQFCSPTASIWSDDIRIEPTNEILFSVVLAQHVERWATGSPFTSNSMLKRTPGHALRYAVMHVTILSWLRRLLSFQEAEEVPANLYNRRSSAVEAALTIRMKT